MKGEITTNRNCFWLAYVGPRGRHHFQLRLNLDEGGRLCDSLRDLHSYPSRYTIIMEPMGQSVKVNHTNQFTKQWQYTSLLPLVPRLPQEDRYEEYSGFKLSLHRRILPSPEILKTGDVSVETAVAGCLLF